jgi:hypothetical protein
MPLSGNCSTDNVFSQRGRPWFVAKLDKVYQFKLNQTSKLWFPLSRIEGCEWIAPYIGIGVEDHPLGGWKNSNEATEAVTHQIPPVVTSPCGRVDPFAGLRFIAAT